MELVSMHDICDSVRQMTGFNVTFKLHCVCDNEAACRTFAAANHQPLHMAADIQARNFEAGSYYCVTHDAHHPFPDRTDVYVC